MANSENNLPHHFGRYTVIDVIASGGMASVYLAKDPVLARLVAIKVLHPHLQAHKALMTRFFQEAQVVAKLRSPNIVEVYDSGKEGRSPYLVMEFVDGLTLDGIFKQLQYETMDEDVAVALMCQAAEGLEVAAKQGVIHRDIKPDNLLISPTGHLKIADFGIAHVLEGSATKTGAIIGTAAYMSPEQANGEKGISPQSDLFSLGAVFYYSLSGKAPFKADSVTGLMKKIIHEPYEPLVSIRPDLDPSIIEIVGRLLNKDPHKRGEGPTWLKLELKKFLLKKQVVDPATRISTYLKELGLRGIQTTGFVNPVVIAAALGERQLDSDKHNRTKKNPWLWFAVTALGLAFTSFISISSWNYFSTHHAINSKTVNGVSSTAPIPKDTSNNFAAPLPSEPVLNLVRKDSVYEAPSKPNHYAEPTPILEPLQKPKRNTVPKKEIVEGVNTELAAFISVESSPPYSDVFLDGRSLGTTPLEEVPVQAGKHKIRIVDQSGKLHLDTLVQIVPGRSSHYFQIKRKD